MLKITNSLTTSSMATRKHLVLVAIYLCVQRVIAKFDPIAFTVEQTAAFSSPNAVTVPFPGVATNHNTAAKIRSGVFTCTRMGVYKFQFYALSTGNARFFLEVYLNQTIVASLYAHETGTYTSAGNAVILDLHVGDTVQVKTKGTFTSSVHAKTNEHYTTFTGVELGALALDSNESPVFAFSVTSEHNQVLPAGTLVQYNNRLVHDNGAFDLSTGVYSAPDSGYYLFHFFGFSHSNKRVWLDLFVNTEYMCSLYGMADFDRADAGNTIITHINEGDNVTVRSHKGWENHLFGTTDHIFTTFSGVQIISDSDLRMPDTEPVVVFSAGLSRNATFAAGTIVKFDKVFCNLEHGYNSATGVFVTPVDGIYEFTFHALAENGTFKTYLGLQHNSRDVVDVFHSGPQADSIGNAVVLELNAGDSVSINNTRHTSRLVAAADEIYCTFSGYLLHANNPDTIFG